MFGQVYVCMLCSDIFVYSTVYIYLDVWWSRNCKSVNDRFRECGLSEISFVFLMYFVLVVIANNNIIFCVFSC